jgi:hypothetical protein
LLHRETAELFIRADGVRARETAPALFSGVSAQVRFEIFVGRTKGKTLASRKKHLLSRGRFALLTNCRKYTYEYSV